MSFPAYPEYEDSGVPWLGHVPAHWNVVQSKRVLQRRKVLNVGMVCKDRLALTMNGVIPRRLDDVDGLQSNDYEGYQIFEPGDLAFKLIDLQNIKTSRVGRVPTRGIMSPAYIRLEPISEEIGGFGYWYFMALYWLQVFNQLGGGVRQTLGADELLTVPFPLPSPDEQRSIAVFLDREMAKIDALVAEQERLIALLKEKRRAVISHAVTKGLDPDAPMKDSGIEWLGEIPAHWDVRPLGALANVVRGGSPRPAGDPRFFAGQGVPWITVGEITKDEFADLTETREFLTDEGAQASRMFAEGTLIYSNSGATLGVPKVLAMPACANDGVVGFQNLAACIDPYFAYFFLASLTDIVREMVKQGSGQPNLNTEIVKRMKMPVPPKTEQLGVVTYVRSMQRKYAGLTQEAQKAIELLRERRAALISAAVTGKIDVRGLVEQSDMEAA